LQRQRRPSSQKLARSAQAIACPGAITGPQPRWLLVDADHRRLTWHSLDAVAWTNRTRSSVSIVSSP
jgi:hypothetical protein